MFDRLVPVGLRIVDMNTETVFLEFIDDIDDFAVAQVWAIFLER